MMLYRHTFEGLSRFFSWGIFVVIVVSTFLVAGPTNLGGPASYVLVDGTSMEPTFHDGDLVIAYERDSYEVGDVIVYDAPVDTQFNVIHRIVERAASGFITQGDNRDEPDGWIAPDSQIYGKSLFHIPNGGTIVTFLRQPAAILAFLAGWLTLAVFDRRRPEDEESEEGRATDELASAPRDPYEPTRFHARLDPAPTVADRAKGKQTTSHRKETISLLAVAALVGGTAGVFVAHAAMLSVNAGVLQTFSERTNIEVPEPATHAVTVEARFFDSGGGDEIGRSPVVFEPVDVTAGQSYAISWNGPGNGGNNSGNSSVVDCDSDEIEFPDPTPNPNNSGEGTFTPTADTSHVLCIVTAPGNVPENINFAIDDGGDITHIELTEVMATDPATCGEEEDSSACLDSPDHATSEVSERDGEQSRSQPDDDEDSNSDPGGVRTGPADADHDEVQTGDGDGADENEADEDPADNDQRTPPEKRDPDGEPVVNDSSMENDETTDHERDGGQNITEDTGDADGASDGEDGDEL